MRNGIFLLAGVCAMAVLVAGCGGGGGGESTTITTSSISKDQFIREVDAICAKGRHQIETAASAYLRENPAALQGKKEPDYGELTQTIFVPAIEQEVKEIRALGAPRKDQATVEAFVAAVEAGVKKSEEEPKLAAVGGGKAFAKANTLAGRYGLASCTGR